ncbi:MAG: sigma-70 family RNA polymerase sigma factor [Candidatus Kapabacteria bacterium]|nr:sigma-70 family RNA polymerase sigma factor [Candidatus Kapabacteria bacterium]
MNVDRNELYRHLTRKYTGMRHDDVHEAVQYAVVVAYETSVLREPPHNLQAYVTTVASRAMSRAITLSRRFVHPERDMYDGWASLEDADSPLITVEAHETNVDAERVITSMPNTYASLLRKHYMEGLPLEQIAKQEGVSPECVRKRHERALKHARKLFL